MQTEVDKDQTMVDSLMKLEDTFEAYVEEYEKLVSICSGFEKIVKTSELRITKYRELVSKTKEMILAKDFEQLEVLYKDI